MDGAAGLLTDFGVVKVKFVKSKVFELVDSEAQFPGNVCPPDRESIVMCWGEGHVVVVK